VLAVLAGTGNATVGVVIAVLIVLGPKIADAFTSVSNSL